jgi:hypothetical protein
MDDTSVHTSMQALAQMATTATAEGSEVRILTALAIRDWERYTQEQVAKLATKSLIEVLCSAFMNAMNDNTSKDKRAASALLRTFFATTMQRIEQEGKDPQDQQLSLPLMMEQLKEFKGDMDKIQMWISVNEYPKRWIKAVLHGLAASGALPPQSGNDTGMCLGSQRLGHEI